MNFAQVQAKTRAVLNLLTPACTPAYRKGGKRDSRTAQEGRRQSEPDNGSRRPCAYLAH